MNSLYAYVRGFKCCVLDKYRNEFVKKARNISHLSFPLYEFGDMNDDKILYFITDKADPLAAMYAIVLSIWYELVFARIMGWEPVIDESARLTKRMKHVLLKDDNFLSDFFDFGNAIPVSDVYKSANVIVCESSYRVDFLKRLGKKERIEDLLTWDSSFFEYNSAKRAYFRNIISDRWQYNNQTKIRLEDTYRELFIGKGKVLGIAVREGKMWISKKAGTWETDQPQIEEYITEAKDKMGKWKCDSLYLSCQAVETIELFKKAFPNTDIIYTDRYRFPISEFMKFGDDSVALKWHKSETRKKERNYEYIEDMYLLTQCNALICTENCGTKASFLMNEKLKDGEFKVLRRFDRKCE